MEVIARVQHKGYTIQVHPDTDPLNPRTDYDNLGKMLCFHRRYNLGDRKGLPQIRTGDFAGWAEMREYLEKEEGALIILPLYLYDHGGITMSVGGFSDPWDSGQVGFIYATRADILKEWSKKRISAQLRAKVEARLRAEVKEYDHYLTGNVWGYTILDPDGAELDDSNWGYIGDYNDMVEECKLLIDHIVKERATQAAQYAIST